MILLNVNKTPSLKETLTRYLYVLLTVFPIKPTVAPYYALTVESRWLLDTEFTKQNE